MPSVGCQTRSLFFSVLNWLDDCHSCCLQITAVLMFSLPTRPSRDGIQSLDSKPLQSNQKIILLRSLSRFPYTKLVNLLHCLVRLKRSRVHCRTLRLIHCVRSLASALASFGAHCMHRSTGTWRPLLVPLLGTT